LFDYFISGDGGVEPSSGEYLKTNLQAYSGFEGKRGIEAGQKLRVSKSIAFRLFPGFTGTAYLNNMTPPVGY